MSGPAIGAIVLVGFLTVVVVAVRIAVAKQRRLVEGLRARLAAPGTVKQRAEGVPVEVFFNMSGSVGRSARVATCTRTADGFYCLSDDGRWGGRVPFAVSAPEGGDLPVATAPCLIENGTVVGATADWLVPYLGSLPPEGLVLQFKGGRIAWIVAIPEAAVWYGALMLALREGGALPGPPA